MVWWRRRWCNQGTNIVTWVVRASFHLLRGGRAVGIIIASKTELATVSGLFLFMFGKLWVRCKLRLTAAWTCSTSVPPADPRFSGKVRLLGRMQWPSFIRAFRGVDWVRSVCMHPLLSDCKDDCDKRIHAFWPVAPLCGFNDSFQLLLPCIHRQTTIQSPFVLIVYSADRSAKVRTILAITMKSAQFKWVHCRAKSIWCSWMRTSQDAHVFADYEYCQR